MITNRPTSIMPADRFLANRWIREWRRRSSKGHEFTIESIMLIRDLDDALFVDSFSTNHTEAQVLAARHLIATFNYEIVI